MIGHEVDIETKDGSKFRGIFSGCGPQVKQIGLSYAFKLPGKGYENYVLSKPDATEKMVFDFSDVVEITHVVQENTNRRFITDKEYNACNGDKTEFQEDLQAWEGDDEYALPDHAHDDKHDGSGGWSVDAMFSVNMNKLGVTTSYKDDLTQYTTVDPEGTEEERFRAEQIAKEIEMNSESKRRALLENDDEERDLDKETNFDKDFESVSSRRGHGAGRRNNTYTKNQPRRSEDGLNQNNNDYKTANPGRVNRGMQSRTGRQFNDQRNPDNFSRPNEIQRPNFTTGKPQRRLDSPGTGPKPGDTQRSQRDFGQNQQRTLPNRQGSKINDLKNWRMGFNIQSPETPTSQPATPTVAIAEMTISPSSSSVPDNTQGSLQMQSVQIIQRQPNAWQNGPPDSFRSNYPQGSAQYSQDQPKNVQYRNERQDQSNGKSSQSPTSKKNEPARRGSEQIRRSSRQSSPKTSPTSQYFQKDPIEPKNDSSIPKVESMPSFTSSMAPTSNFATTVVTSIAEPSSIVTTTEASSDKAMEKTSLSTAASTSNLSDATTTGGRKKFEFNPDAPAFVPKPKNEIGQVASSPAPVMPIPTPTLIPQHVPIPITPTPILPPPSVMGQPPVLVNFQAPNVYGMPHQYITTYPPAAVPSAQPIAASQQQQPLAQSVQQAVQQTRPIQSQTPSGTSSSSAEAISTNTAVPANGGTGAQAMYTGSVQSQQQSFNTSHAGGQMQGRFVQSFQQPNAQVQNPNSYIQNQQIQYQSQVIPGQYQVMQPGSVMGQPPIMVSYQQMPAAYGVQNPLYSYPPNMQNAQAIATSRQQSATPPVHVHQNYPLPSQTPSSEAALPSNMMVSNNGQPIYAVNIPQGQQQTYNPNMAAMNRFPQPFQPQGQMQNQNMYIAPQIPYQQQFVQGQYPQGQIIFPVLPNQYVMYANPMQQVNSTNQMSMNAPANVQNMMVIPNKHIGLLSSQNEELPPGSQHS
uniref:LsmAD domain-containing protein n=1 Tax=Acrobeloides nanus TaxID=290746 RepID=A0A914D6F6_9BILA